MEAMVQMTGYVGGDVDLRRGTVAVANFRLACTPRIRRAGEWEDGHTTWISVSCFRTLAEHVAGSIKKGDPVMVSGRLRTSIFERDGSPVERLTLEATAVGHDLNRGTTSFRRAERAASGEDADGPEVHEGDESAAREVGGPVLAVV